MSLFRALNVDYDDVVDDEPDDTKEVQIEEALKVYANALKYHSQGRTTLKEAGEAYDELFKSEIFTYPESLSEYKRIELYGQPELDTILEEAPEVEVAPVTTETGPSTLPQILHLSYKNRGQYYLNLLESELEQEDAQQAGHHRHTAQKALEDFVDSLDKDDDDVDLWRRAAKVGGVLGSERIARFCLEGALDGDEQETDDVLGMPNVETGVAGEDLRKLEILLGDELAVARKVTKKPVPPVWKKQMEIFSFLPEQLPKAESQSAIEDGGAGTTILEVPQPTWTALGQAILDQLHGEDSGTAVLQPGITWKISMPDIADTTDGTADANVPVVRRTSPADTVTNADQEQIAEVSTLNGATGTKGSESDEKHLEPTTLPVRKRSTDTANLSEGGADGDRALPKRPRTRKSLAVEEGNKGGEPSSDYDFQIQSSIQADQWLFGTVNGIVQKLGVAGLGVPEALRALISPDPVPNAPEAKELEALSLRQVVKDFYTAIESWDQSKSQVLAEQSSVPDLTASPDQHAGLMTFLESSKSATAVTRPLHNQNLKHVVKIVNEDACSSRDMARLWLDGLLCIQSQSGGTGYRDYLWEPALKQLVVQIIILLHDDLVAEVQHEVEAVLDSQNVHAFSEREIASLSTRTLILAQTLFELHLDVYAASTDPASNMDYGARIVQKDRLEVWSELARETINLYANTLSGEDSSVYEEIKLRHLWTSVFQLAKSDEVGREHLVACLEELKKDMASRNNIVIDLPNNAVIPEISASAAEREVSKLETMDFFLGIFKKEGKASVDLIEDLEPLLESSLLATHEDEADGSILASSQPVQQIGDDDTRARQPSASQTLTRFFNQSNTSTRLLLWRRLRDAYEDIDYPPKVLSICLRIIELLMTEVKSSSYTSKQPEERETLLLAWLRECSEMLPRVLQLMQDHKNALEFIDVEHLRSSFNALLDLWNVLYTVALYDDYSTAGGKGGCNRNPFRFYPREVFHSASVKFHDMQIQLAVLLYKLVLEGISQAPEAFEDPIDDRMVLLRHFHYHWGVRRLCKASDQLFLKFMKDELVLLGQPTKQVSDDLAQVLYDLFSLHTFSSSWEKWDHECDPDYFDKDTALQILPFVMEKAREINIKDLMKSELAKTIEQVNSTLGQIKSGMSAARNRKLINSYLKSPLRPLELFRCLEGIDELLAVPVAAEEALVASKGWYFLRGQMIMLRLNAQRSKGVQIPEEDIQSAITFFLQDLEYDPEHWETWMRLGQAYDALLEQQVSWTADHLNNDQEEVQTTQRAAIHAYAAAVASALRVAEPSVETATKLAELYSDFGMRIYASSRPPFAMGVFASGGSARHFSGEEAGRGHYVYDAYSTMDPLTTWRFASNLFTRATKLKPDYWLNYYMLGKCLWKIHQAYDEFVADHPPTAVQEAFIKSVETLPRIKRGDRQEPILDSIFRAAFTAHKLVLREDIDEEEGATMITTILKKQNQFEVPRMPERTRFPTWSLYMLDVFRVLRAADKKSWHHRIVNRAAELIYRIPDDPREGAKLAKDYIVDQHVYNRSYTITIWKPENERPGRHWVYMTKYAAFVAKIFEETDDLDGMEILARRVRRKPSEYYEHVALWEDVVSLHLKLHRRHGQVAQGLADLVFINIDMDEFNAQAKLIDQWINSPTTVHPLKDALRETAELKKLNAALIKTTDIDDLIGDMYAMIWRTIGPKLRPKPELTPTPPAAPAHAPSIQSHPQAPSSTSPPRPDSRSIMSLSNLMHMDGAGDSRPSSFVSNPASRPVTPPPHAAAPALSTPAQEALTPNKPRPRLISRREIIKRASDTVANLKPTASAAAARDNAASKTGSPPPSAGASARRGGRSGTETDPKPAADAPDDTTADDEVDKEIDNDREGDVEGDDTKDDDTKGSGSASRRGSLAEHDGNDADDESGSDLDDADEEQEDQTERPRDGGDDADIAMGDARPDGSTPSLKRKIDVAEDGNESDESAEEQERAEGQMVPPRSWYEQGQAGWGKRDGDVNMQ